LLSVTVPVALLAPELELEDELDPHAARYRAAVLVAPVVMNLRRVRWRS
jgi:hypothetical protein